MANRRKKMMKKTGSYMRGHFHLHFLIIFVCFKFLISYDLNYYYLIIYCSLITVGHVKLLFRLASRGCLLPLDVSVKRGRDLKMHDLGQKFLLSSLLHFYIFFFFFLF